MAAFLSKKTDDIMIACPMCNSCKSISLKALDEGKKRKVVVFACTCGNRFKKRIIRKDFRKIDIISAIANADFEVLWFKLKQILFLFGNSGRSEKVRLVEP